MDRNNALTDPKKLVRVELKNAGFDIDKIKIPDRVYLLADDIFDEMVSRNVGEYRYPLGGKLYVFNKNENIGFIKRAYVLACDSYTSGGFNCRRR